MQMMKNASGGNIAEVRMKRNTWRHVGLGHQLPLFRGIANHNVPVGPSTQYGSLNLATQATKCLLLHSARENKEIFWRYVMLGRRRQLIRKSANHDVVRI
jgi:hypothetical protein